VPGRIPYVCDNMRFINRLNLFRAVLVALGVASASPGHTQTLRQVPVSLSRAPTGATAANPWWQHLVIELKRNPSAGNTISLPLPTGMTIADTDGDGLYTDEVSLDGETGRNTGYRSVSGTTASSLQLVSTTGGTLGPVHVQFPVVTSASASGTATYGPVTFSNGGEQTIPSGTLNVTWVSANGLQLANPARAFVDGVADTTTNLAGDRYPSPASAVFTAPLPNLVRDDLGLLTANHLTALGLPYANGDDSDDVSFAFWWSTTDSLSLVNTTTATAALDASLGTTATTTEADSARLAFDVSGLATGTWYLYMTSPLTGTFPLVRSRGVTVRHAPQVLSVASATSGDPDWLDSGRLLDFDKGTEGLVSAARDALPLTVSVIDYDDTASVRLFYSATGTLDTTVITTSGSAPNRTITGLTGASHVDSTVTLQEGIDSTLSWSVGPTDTTEVTAGDYFVYAVMTDGTDLAIGRSDTLYHVRHSPFLGLDTRQGDAAVNTGGAEPQRYYSVSWNQDYGIDGDFDRDTSGGTISLYYSDDDGFAIPGGAAAVEAAAADPARDTHAITTGLSVDSDGQSENQYRWDLWTYSSSDASSVPVEGVPYTIYGIITTGSTKRLVRWEDGAGAGRTLTFTHDPHVTILSPLAAVSVDGRRSFGVSWEAEDVDDAASIWVFLTPAADNLTVSTFGDLEAGASALWTGTSTDGSLATGRAEREGSSSSTSVRPSRLLQVADGTSNPIRDGEYDVWVVIDPTAGATPAAASTVTKAPGSVTLTGFGSGSAAGLSMPALEILPSRATMSTWRDTLSFSLRPNTGGDTVDVVSVFLSVDTLLVDIVDQNTTTAGIQPFAVNAALGGQTLYDSVKAGTDSTVAGLWVMDLVYFEQAGRVFDGDTELARISLTSKDTAGTARLRLDNLAPRRSAFYRAGNEVGSLAPETGSVIELKPRGSLAGSLQLQGRTVHHAEVTFELRDRNSFAPVSDSLFIAVNDVNTTKAGLQDTLDTLGAFQLTQVPSGTWHLTAKVDRYLDGQVTPFQISPGQALSGLQPTLLRDGVTRAPYLLGGDVTGWTDTSGVAAPDNEVDQLDVDFVVSHFGSTTTPAHAGQLADVDGDSLVWVPDLNMVAANFGRDGVRPSYRRAGAVEPSARLRLESQRDAAGGLTVAVIGDALPPVRAWGLTVAYDDRLWEPVGGESRALFGARRAVEAWREEPGRVHLGAALLGNGVSDVDRGLVGRIEFRPVPGARVPGSQGADAGAAVRLLAATVVGEDHLPRPATWENAALPRDLALHPAFPNPFNPETALRFDLPVAATVRLEVFDAAGQRVRLLLDERLDTGTHTLRWDGRDAAGRAVASGAYFARLSAAGSRLERKMLLLR
jgi:hypothetical protein